MMTYVYVAARLRSPGRVIHQREPHPTNDLLTKLGDHGLRTTLFGEVARGEPLEITVDGRPSIAFRGESLAAALIASGLRRFRGSARLNQPRGVFCGIGICYECLLIIDGVPNQRACVTEVRAGMSVETQTGRGIGVVVNSEHL